MAWSGWSRRFLVVLGVLVVWLVLCVGSAAAFLGDVTYDGTVSLADLQAIADALGSNKWSGATNWNPEADLDLHGEVNVADLAIARRSYGSDRNFHAPRPLSNSGKSAVTVGACQDASGRIHVAWTERTATASKVRYTRLDRYGNTLVDDLELGKGDQSGDMAIACNSAGDAHIIWGCIGVCQARVDQWGYLVLQGSKADDQEHSSWGQLALAMDDQGWAHAAYTQWSRTPQVYAMITEDGRLAARTEGPPGDGSSYTSIAVDAYGAPHIVRESQDNRQLLYLRQAAGDQPAIPERAIADVNWASTNPSHTPALALDSAGNASVLFRPTLSDDLHGLHLEKIGRDGASVIDDQRLWPGWRLSPFIGRPLVDLTADEEGNLHAVALGSFGSGPEPLTYGVLDDQGNQVQAPRYVLYGAYGEGPTDPQLMVDGERDIHVVYHGKTNGYPPCPDGALCYQGTAFTPESYDRTRADLGVDLAHLSWEPLVARWGSSLQVTATFFNAGWTSAPASPATVSLMLSPDVVAAQATLDVPALQPGQSHQVQVTLSLGMAPAGYEGLEYGRLVLAVDSDGALAETTEENNVVSAPVVLQPLPTQAGLFLVVRDDTETVLGRDGTPVTTGTAQISGGLNRDVAVSESVTVLGKDLPVGDGWTSYTVGWSASGYRQPTPATVSIRRDPADPYLIEYDPADSNTVLLATDRWGSLSGTVSVAGATVRATGAGLDLEATTDGSGNYSFPRLIPGTYEVRASCAGYERATASIPLGALESRSWSPTLGTTTIGYLHGQVTNPNGTPVVGATVTLVGGGSAATDGSGYYDLSADVGSGPYPVRGTLQVTAAGYEAASQEVDLTAGLETVADVELSYDPTTGVVSRAGGRASWEQDEGSADLLPDPPDDAAWGVEKGSFDKFVDEFWPSFRVQVWWGCFEYEITARYTGTGPRLLQDVQLRLVPKTFEQHRVSGEGEVEIEGHGIGVEIGVLQDSGALSALQVIEARLVDADSGTVLKTVPGFWDALAEETRTYSFEGAQIDDWANAEVWIYLKVGKNEDSEWTSSPILRGWRLDQQVLRLDLDSENVTVGYVLVDFPVP